MGTREDKVTKHRGQLGNDSGGNKIISQETRGEERGEQLGDLGKKWGDIREHTGTKTCGT